MIQKNINEFNKWGATCVRQLLNEKELIKVKIAIEENCNHPSPMFDSFQNENKKPLFFNDFNNWRRLDKIKEICFWPKLAKAARLLMGSQSVHLFHDHVIVKKKGSSLKTPWHIDGTYFMVDGEYTVSLWIPTHDISKEESLIFAKGSHLERKEYAPKDFTNSKKLENSKEFVDFDIDYIENNFDLINWDMKKGDVIAFTYYTLHMAPEVEYTYDRDALSIRYFGNGTTFDSRVKNPAPPFTQIGYKANHGDPIKENWFPKIKIS